MRIVRIAALACALAACTKLEAFECTIDMDCGGGGFCEADHACSVVDTSCTTGRRYDPTAGALAGTCTASIATCGDGVLRAGAEECDDGNQDDNDGCTSRCIKCPLGAVVDPVSGHCYWLGASATRGAASGACKSLNGYLASIHDANENALVARIGAGPRWIGLDSNGWQSDEPLVYTNFPAPPSPDGCAVIDDNGSWSVTTCPTSHEYICEHEPSLVDPITQHVYHHIGGPAKDAARGAIGFCEARGSHLATLERAGEYNVVAPLQRGPTWIGLQRAAPNSTAWIWLGGAPLVETHWAPGQPGNELCVAWRDNGWATTPCNMQFPFVCEVD